MNEEEFFSKVVSKSFGNIMFAIAYRKQPCLLNNIIFKNYINFDLLILLLQQTNLVIFDSFENSKEYYNPHHPPVCVGTATIMCPPYARLEFDVIRYCKFAVILGKNTLNKLNALVIGDHVGIAGVGFNETFKIYKEFHLYPWNPQTHFFGGIYISVSSDGKLLFGSNHSSML